MSLQSARGRGGVPPTFFGINLESRCSVSIGAQLESVQPAVFRQFDTSIHAGFDGGGAEDKTPYVSELSGRLVLSERLYLAGGCDHNQLHGDHRPLCC